MFPGSYFAAPYFIGYGGRRPSTDGADQYVYAISNNGFWDNGDRLFLGRVRRDRIGLLRGMIGNFWLIQTDRAARRGRRARRMPSRF
jgi:hypothetical protein